MTVGLGIVTCGRPDYLRQVVDGVQKNLSAVVDEIVVYEDRDTIEPRHEEYEELRVETMERPVAEWITATRNNGVAHAKNYLARVLLEHGHEWIFLLEDDIVPVSPKAVTGYVDACLATGIQHLSFHAHGPANPPHSAIEDGQLTYWPNSVGAFAIYSRASLETAGLFDEGMFNAFEHVEHSQRLAAAGFTTRWPKNADASGSEKWLEEIAGSIENGIIRRRPDWGANIEAAHQRWRELQPDTFRLVFGASA